MNLFLLVAVPISSVLLHHLFYRDFTVAQTFRPWIPAAVWSVVLLVASMTLFSWTIFDGNVLTTFLGQVCLNTLLVPGVAVFLHGFPKTAPRAGIQTPRGRALGLGLTLAITYTLLGLGDFLTTSRQSDVWDLFLLPLVRVALIGGLPVLGAKYLENAAGKNAWMWLAALGGGALSEPLLAAFWYAGWGWLSAILTPLLVCAAVWGLLKTAPDGDGSLPQTAA